MSVIVLGAIGGAITVSLLFFGIEATQNSDVLARSARAKMLANACAEEALIQLHTLSTYTGDDTLEIDGDTCTYSVSSTSETDVEILSTGTAETTTRKVKIQIDSLSPTLNVSSWQEVAEF